MTRLFFFPLLHLPLSATKKADPSSGGHKPGGGNNWSNAFSILLFFLTLAPLTFAAALTLSNLDLPDGIALKSEYYEVDSAEYDQDSPGFLKFRVNSEHATYEVVGLLELVKLLREIEVIEKVRRNEKTSGFFDGAASSVEATGKGFVSFVSHPIGSAKGIGKAAGKLGGMFGRAFRRKEEGEQTSFSEKVLGSSRRELAKEFGVDVYTTNPYLNGILNQMARARLGGKGAVAVIKLLVPVVMIASVTITASGVNAAADHLVNDSSTADLFRSNQEALVGFGFEKEEVKCLLNSLVLTPREVTYLRFYFEKLKNVPGYEGILTSVCRAVTPEQARKILYEAQIAAEEIGGNPDYEKLGIFSEGLALADSKRLIFITAYDYLDESDLGEQTISKASRLAEEWKKSGLEIWNGGKVTSEFHSAVSRWNIKTRSWLLFETKSD